MCHHTGPMALFPLWLELTVTRGKATATITDRLACAAYLIHIFTGADPCSKPSFGSFQPARDGASVDQHYTPPCPYRDESHLWLGRD